uniref:RxLR effector candidate protein n=1 Tax=Hyaloperonospora arabidopsidis (strain Emoy2) TaxID=559515 RepID=M4BBI6_HYAAE
MRIALVVDTLAVAVAVCVVVSSTAASGVRKASTTATSDTSSYRARILQTVHGADKDSEEARMLPFSSILGRLRKTPEVDQLLTENLLENTGSTDVYNGPLSSDMRRIIKVLVSKEEDVLHWQKLAEGLDDHSISPKSRIIHEELAKHHEQSRLLEVELQSKIEAAVKTNQFKDWFRRVTSNPGGDSPTKGKVLQEAEFDYWFSLDTQSKEGVLERLSSSTVQNLEMSTSLSGYIADQYMVYYRKKLAELSSSAVVVR